MRAIETRYAGCRFRSRLEARWAVFFDAMDIQWEYEPEGFWLSSGTGYLPDFRLPTFGGGMFVEVKPPGNSFEKARIFALESGTPIWLAEGPPSFRAYRVLYNGDGSDLDWYWGIPLVDRARCENRMFADPDDIDPDGVLGPSWRDSDFGEAEYVAAVERALSARFEGLRQSPHGMSTPADVIGAAPDGVLGSVRRILDARNRARPRAEGTETA